MASILNGVSAGMLDDSLFTIRVIAGLELDVSCPLLVNDHIIERHARESMILVKPNLLCILLVRVAADE